MKLAYWVVFLGIASCVNRSVVSVEETAEASLSEIAEHVVAIPLETNERCRMGPVDAVKRAGSEFFMLSNRMLYRFDRTGRFGQPPSNALPRHRAGRGRSRNGSTGSMCRSTW